MISSPDRSPHRSGLALRTGIDRDASRRFWNEEGHDHQHDRNPRGKRPDEINAFTLDLDHIPYKLPRDADVEDVTEGLDERQAGEGLRDG